jgi:hypothetical protein
VAEAKGGTSHWGKARRSFPLSARHVYANLRKPLQGIWRVCKLARDEPAALEVS